MEEKYLKDNAIKHLDYLQNQINRMSTIQFQIKGWTITLVSATLALYANSYSKNSGNPLMLLVPIASTLLFWILDARYFTHEKRIRALYNDVIHGKEGIKPFEFPLDRYEYPMIKAMFNFENSIMYFGIIVCLIAILVIVKISVPEV